ncbi:hypothetical protein K438DRAFT_593760 [Mycena galopus ATCC 62051]|nr:hypothetical protein K438DRAFT_593760 [Mycena galopus ATCC 62051]
MPGAGRGSRAGGISGAGRGGERQGQRKQAEARQCRVRAGHVCVMVQRGAWERGRRTDPRGNCRGDHGRWAGSSGRSAPQVALKSRRQELWSRGVGLVNFKGNWDAREYQDPRINSGESKVNCEPSGRIQGLVFCEMLHRMSKTRPASFQGNRPPDAAFVKKVSLRCGQRSVISEGTRAIQSSGSEIRVARTLMNSIAKAERGKWVQRAGGSQCSGGGRVMRKDD